MANFCLETRDEGLKDFIQTTRRMSKRKISRTDTPSTYNIRIIVVDKTSPNPYGNTGSSTLRTGYRP